MECFKILVCGDTSCQITLDALQGLKGEFEIVGLLARETKVNQQCAQYYKIKLYSNVAELPNDIQLAMITSSVINTPPEASAELVEKLLEHGLHVLQEQPVNYEDIIRWMKIARKNHLCYAVGNPLVYLSSLAAFGNCMAMLTKQTKITHIDIDLDIGIVYSIIHLLIDSLPQTRMFTIKSQTSVSNENSIVNGELGGIPFLFRIRSRCSPESGLLFPQLHRLTIGTCNGNLSVTGLAGTIVWEQYMIMPYDNTPFQKSEQYSYSFDSPCTTIRNSKKMNFREFISQEWAEAIKTELSKMREKIFTNRQDAASAQREILCAKNWNLLAQEINTTETTKKVIYRACNPYYLKQAVQQFISEDSRQEITIKDYCETLDKEYLLHCLEKRDQTILQTMLHVFQQNGLFLSNEAEHDTAEILTALKAAPEQVHVILRWLKVLCQRRYLKNADGKYIGTQRISEEQLKSKWDQVTYLWNYRLGSPLTTEYLLNNINSLPELISGQQKATLLLFPEGRTDYANSLYKETLILKYFNYIIAKKVISIGKQKGVFQKSAQQKLNILEIGAGTGATTETVFYHLSQTPYLNCVTYMFTDLSTFFLREAKRQFSANLPISYQLVNIDRSLSKQGIESGSADIIIAVGVLNNAQNTDSTVADLLDTLADNGWLFVVETVTEVLDMLVSQAFMMEHREDVRKDDNTTFLSTRQWRTVFQTAGAKEIVMEYPKDNHPLNLLGQKLFIVKK